MPRSRFPVNVPLYFVTDHKQTRGRPQLEIIKSALEGGVRLVQYRDKNLPDVEFRRKAEEVLALCRSHGAMLLINDRVEIAKAIGADGVHLGQEDMDPEEARSLLGPTAVIGLSTHNREEVEAAQSKPLDYINIGPMFPTATKDHSRYGALGQDVVLELARLSRFPFTTMGGIKMPHLKGLFEKGVHTVAMVTEISLAEDVTSKVREILAEIGLAYPAVGSGSAPGKGGRGA